MVFGLGRAEVLRSVLSNPVDLEILRLLSSMELYAREIAEILGRDETDVSRRISKLRRLGLLECRWTRIDDRNVKLCWSKIKSISISFSDEGIIINIEYKDGVSEKIAFNKQTYSTIPRPIGFIGREKYLEEIKNTRHRVVILWGLPGAGKTYLAAKYALSQNKPVFWYNVSSISCLRHFAVKIAYFLDLLGDPELAFLVSGTFDQSMLIENILAKIRSSDILVVIDDLHKISDRGLRVLLSLLIEDPGRTKIIITTREIKDWMKNGDVEIINVKGFTIEEMKKYLQKNNVDLPPKAVINLYVATNGLPGLLTLFLKLYPEQISIEDFKRSRLFEYLLSNIYDKLSDEEKKILNILIISDEPVSYNVIKHVTGSEPGKILAALLKKGLIIMYGEKYYVHDLFRILRKQLDADTQRNIQVMIGDYYREKMKDHIYFFKALIWYSKASYYKGIARIVISRILKDLDYHMANPNKYIEIISEALNKSRLSFIERISLLYEYGRLLVMVHGDERGFEYLEECLTLTKYPETDTEKIIRAHCLINLAYFYSNRGLLDKAGILLVEAESLINTIREEEYREILLRSLYSTRVFYNYRRLNIDEAISDCEKAIKIAKKMGEERYYAHTLMYLAIIYMVSKRFREAVNVYNQLINLPAIKLNPYSYGSVISGLAEAYAYIGELRRSLELINEALKIFKRIHSKSKLGEAYCIKTMILYRMKKYGEALQTAEKAYQIVKEYRNCSTAELILQYILILLRTDNRDKAYELYSSHKELIEKCRSVLKEYFSEINSIEPDLTG